MQILSKFYHNKHLTRLYWQLCPLARTHHNAQMSFSSYRRYLHVCHLRLVSFCLCHILLVNKRILQGWYNSRVESICSDVYNRCANKFPTSGISQWSDPRSVLIIPRRVIQCTRECLTPTGIYVTTSVILLCTMRVIGNSAYLCRTLVSYSWWHRESETWEQYWGGSGSYRRTRGSPGCGRPSPLPAEPLRRSGGVTPENFWNFWCKIGPEGGVWEGATNV